MVWAACGTSPTPPNTGPEQEQTDGGDSPDPRDGSCSMRYRGKPVKTTKHGRCRMDCRKIDACEIQEVLEKGRINARKSQQGGNGKGPTTALEGFTHDRQEVRIVVAEYEKYYNLVTVIDLRTDFSCACD